MVKKLAAVRMKSHRRKNRAANEGDVSTLINIMSHELNPYIERDLFGNLIAKSGIDPWLVRDLFALVFIYETGARVGELVELGSLPMNKAVATRSSVYSITMVGKTDDRDRWFTQSTADMWALWTKVRPEGAEDYAVVGWIWDGTLATPMRPDIITQAIQRRCVNAGIPPFTSKALRHAKVKRARAIGGIEVPQFLLDHSQLSTTMNYDWGADEFAQEAALATGLKLSF